MNTTPLPQTAHLISSKIVNFIKFRVRVITRAITFQCLFSCLIEEWPLSRHRIRIVSSD